MRGTDHSRWLPISVLVCVATTACTHAPAPRPAPTIADPWDRHVLDAGYLCRTAVAADLDGDEQLDVLVSDFDDGHVYLLQGPTFLRRTIASGVQPIHGQLVDVDGDGDQDYVGVDYQPGQVFWLENPRGGETTEWTLRFIDRSVDGGANGLHAIIVVDADGDGRQDLITTSNLADGPVADSIVWYPIPENAADVEAWPRRLIADGDAPGFVHYLGFGDLDGDGWGDVVAGAKTGHYFAWWKAPGSGDTAWVRQDLAGPQEGATHIEVGDVNGDDAVDLIASRGHGVGLLWYRGPDYEAVPIDDELEAPHSLAVGDVDGDGDLDVATVANDSHMAVWFENDGQGGFTRHTISSDQRSYDVRLLDMDGDRDLDLLVAGENSRNVVWYENPGR